MGRSNTPASLEHWLKHERSLPFRASIGSNCHWDVGRPPPYLIGASKVCRGGRMILAFPLAETRDYFVEGHSDQGAQAETDFSETPTPKRAAPRGIDLPSDYEAARRIMITELAGYNAASEAVADAFLRHVAALVDGNRIREAVALTRSMPADCVEKSLAWSRIVASGGWDKSKEPEHGIEPAPLDARRASANYGWMKASNVMNRISEPFYDIARRKAEQVLADDGYEALVDMIENVPPFVGKVHLVMFARKNAPTPANTNPVGMRP